MTIEGSPSRRKRAPTSHVVERPDGGWLLDISATGADGVRRRRRATFPSKTAAEKAETVAMRRVENGLPPFPEPEEAAWTVADVLRLYHSSHVPDTEPRSRARCAEHRAALERFLAPIEAERLTYDELVRYRRERKDEYAAVRPGKPLSDVTVKKELSHLRAALRYAKVSRKIARHVFEELTRDMRASLLPAETKSAGQVIDDEAWTAILGRVPEGYRAALRLMRLTGMRKGEIAALRWENVKRDRISIVVSKTGAREVPLTDEMRAVLPPRRTDGTALVFEAADGGSIYWGLGGAWDGARRGAGFPTLRVHDIRHTVATELDEFGDRTAMKAALGMSDATVSRYAEHRKHDRARALFLRAAETRRKLGATRADAISSEA